MQKLDFLLVMPTFGSQCNGALRTEQYQSKSTSFDKFKGLAGLLGSALAKSLSHFARLKNCSASLSHPTQSTTLSKKEVNNNNPGISTLPFSNNQNKQEKIELQVKAIKIQSNDNQVQQNNKKDGKDKKGIQNKETSKEKLLSPKLPSPQKKEKSKKNMISSSIVEKKFDASIQDAVIPMPGSLKKRKIIMKKKKLLKRQVEHWGQVAYSFKGKREAKGLYR